MSLRVEDIVLVENKDKTCINHSGKYGYVTVCYLVSGESEEVGVKQAELIRVNSVDQIIS